jgi:hypothetical protein
VTDTHLSILNRNFLFPFLPSLILTSFCLFIVGVQGPPPSLSPSPMHTRARGKTPLDKGSAHHRDLYLTTHNTHKRERERERERDRQTDRHPSFQWDSNPQSLQTSNCRPTPSTTQPMGLAQEISFCNIGIIYSSGSTTQS